MVSPQIVGFWGKRITQSDVRYRVAISTIKLAKVHNRKKCSTSSLALEIEGHSDLKFEFKTRALRDEAIRRINEAVEADRATLSSPPSSASASTAPSISSQTEISSTSYTGLVSPICRTVTVASLVLPDLPSTLPSNLPKAINIPRGFLLSKPSSHFVCLTIGSRGDVQPYIALGLGLMKEGHRVTIVTHEEYREWVEGFGIMHRAAGGDPAALMKLTVENKV